MNWWDERVFYQVYLPSFCDGNDDGIGDFIGLNSKLDYLADLGVGGIWITPFYPSPLVDNGYDVSDYCNIDSRFGNLEHFKSLVKKCHELDIKVIIDIVINHVSDQHPWFIDAVNNPESKYRDYFIFKDIPNNWESFFSGTAWEKESEKGQYYYHKFSKHQVDLNWSNKEVENEFYDIFDFWIELGVDGFRFDVVNFILTDGITKDNPNINDNQDHIYDINQSKCKDTLERICQYIRNKGDYFLIGEIGSDELSTIKQYQSKELLDVVFNFNFSSIDKFNVKQVADELDKMNKEMAGKPTLFFSSHDMKRAITRLSVESPSNDFALSLIALTLFSKGIPFIYNGEEIGMKDFVPKDISQIFDVQGKNNYLEALKTQGEEEAFEVALKETRDYSRSPMQWSIDQVDNMWMPLNDDNHITNVEAQVNNPNSVLSKVKQIIKLRNSLDIMKYGNMSEVIIIDDVLTFERNFGNEKLTCLFNFSEKKLNIPSEQFVYHSSSSKYIDKNNFIIY